MHNKIIRLNKISKSFGTQLAVDNISFDIDKGSLFAFLGQNGAGKSTTINMLIGMLQSDTGEIIYENNEKLNTFKNKIGIVFQNNILDDNLTVEENLLLYGELYIQNHKKAKIRLEEIILLFQMEEYRKKRYITLSGGQKRKVEIARALFNKPSLLFLDEPTTGLDPKTRKEVWQILHNIRQTQKLTIFLTTHYMEETIDSDKVVIIHKGKKICEGTPTELKSKYSYDQLFITPYNEIKLENYLKEQLLDFRKTADTYAIKIINTIKSIELLNHLKDNIKFYEVIKGNMDNVFLNSVGENIKENE